MKTFYLLSVMFIAALSVSAQAPAKINYQAVARNAATGVVVGEQDVYIIASIREGSPGGSIVYQEEHADISTNAFGLFSVYIGGGAVTSGNFNEIQWSDGAYWLEIQIDIGNGLETLGAMQFMSVPYALHSQTTENVEDADADPTNELINQAFYSPEVNGIVIQEGIDNELTIDLSGFSVDDADADPTNELINDAFYSPEANGIVIQEGLDNEVIIDLSEFSADDADADPTNELINDAFYSPDEHGIVIQEGLDNNVIIDMSEFPIDDADNDPTNEMITEFSLFGTNLFIQEVNSHTVSLSRFKIDSLRLFEGSILEVFEGGTPHGVDLGVLANEEHWFRAPESSVVYNETDNIGIGTSGPTAKLEVKNDQLDIADFAVTNASNIPMLHIGSNRVGIGTNEPKSSFELRGSVGVGLTIIKEDDSPYSVTPTDNIIVCRLSSVLPEQLVIELPDPSTCPGRLITVRKTGPNHGAVSVFFDFGGAQLDYGSAVLILSGSQPKTVTLLSLGADGWTELISP